VNFCTHASKGSLYSHHQARHLAVVVDSVVALWALARDGKQWHGLYSENEVFASAIKGYIRHVTMIPLFNLYCSLAYSKLWHKCNQTLLPMNKMLKISRKDAIMKITIGPFSLDVLLLLRLWLPPVVFIGLCTAIFFLPFHMLLLTLDDIAPHLIGIAWLSLLIFYIISGVAFTYFYARFFRASFASEDMRGRRGMAILSGLPFYALCFLFLLDMIYCLFSPDDVGGLAAFVSVVGFVGFALVSGAYLLLLRFLLRRSTVIAPVQDA
jgi:hypothetical protein